MRHNSGFTLVELIMVIVVLAAVSTGIASFMRGSIQGYVDVSARQQLLTESRYAMERMQREIRTAVPNSLRIKGNSSQHCLEFVPINWSTIYTSLPLLPSTDTNVDIVFPYDIDNNVYPIQVGEFALVYPRLTADVYDTGNNKLRAISACSDDGDGSCTTRDDSDDIIQLTVAGAFAESSPASRLYFVDHSINYCVVGGYLVRFENDIVATQASGATSQPKLAGHVVNTLSANPSVSPGADDPFVIIAATLQRNATVQLQLRFSDNDEEIAYEQEVHIANVP